MICGFLDRFRQLLHNMPQRRHVRVTHAEIHNINVFVAQLHLELAHYGKNVRRQPFNPRKFVHGLAPPLTCARPSARPRPEPGKTTASFLKPRHAGRKGRLLHRPYQPRSYRHAPARPARRENASTLLLPQRNIFVFPSFITVPFRKGRVRYMSALNWSYFYPIEFIAY